MGQGDPSKPLMGFLVHLGCCFIQYFNYKHILMGRGLAEVIYLMKISAESHQPIGIALVNCLPYSSVSVQDRIFAVIREGI